MGKSSKLNDLNPYTCSQVFLCMGNLKKEQCNINKRKHSGEQTRRQLAQGFTNQRKQEKNILQALKEIKI